MPKKIPLALKFYDKVIVFFHKEQNRALSTAQQERESLLGELTKLYYNAKPWGLPQNGDKKKAIQHLWMHEGR